MTIEAVVVASTPAQQLGYMAENTVKSLGIIGTGAIVLCCVLSYFNIAHTDIGWFVVDQLLNGEARFNANTDIHGDWGNIAFSIVAAPLFIGVYLAAGISAVREYFTGAAE